MGNYANMTLSEIDAAIARNLMKWRRLTRAAAITDSVSNLDENESAKSLDPHWFDREGHIVALAETTGAGNGTRKTWSPTRRAADAQEVRNKLAETFKSIVLSRLAVGTDFLFSLFVHGSNMGSSSKLHLALGESEEIATSLCALETVGIDAKIQKDSK